MGRLEVYHFLAEEAEDIDLFNGMLDRAKCEEILTHLIEPEDVTGFFICGPGPMMHAAEEAFLERGVERHTIHIDPFTADTPSPSVATHMHPPHHQPRGLPNPTP